MKDRPKPLQNSAYPPPPPVTPDELVAEPPMDPCPVCGKESPYGLVQIPRAGFVETICASCLLKRARGE